LERLSGSLSVKVIYCSETTGSDILNADANSGSIDESLPGISLKRKTFRGKYAISADEFDAEFVCG
jgi:hypothetical protein